jgi:Zn finger protein HypA/HybF involved in hydrogenase expression
MTAKCPHCGRQFRHDAAGVPQCPTCGTPAFLLDTPPINIGGESGQKTILAGERLTVTLLCLNGHAFLHDVPRMSVVPCPHGTQQSVQEDGTTEVRAVQVNLSCRTCGAALSVVGEVGVKTCPRCGEVMVCPLCAAAAASAQAGASEENIRCPTCGAPPAQVEHAPPVRFVGDITKTVH